MAIKAVEFVILYVTGQERYNHHHHTLLNPSARLYSDVCLYVDFQGFVRQPQCVGFM